MQGGSEIQSKGLGECEDLSLDPPTQTHNPEVMAQVCNPGLELQGEGQRQDCLLQTFEPTINRKIVSFIEKKLVVMWLGP